MPNDIFFEIHTDLPREGLPDVKLDYETSGSYDGFDAFGWVVQQLWRDYGASADRDKYRCPK